MQQKPLYRNPIFPQPVWTLQWKLGIFRSDPAFSVTRWHLTLGRSMVMKSWHLAYCGNDMLKQFLHSPRHFHIKLCWAGSNEMDHGALSGKLFVSSIPSLSLSLPLSLSLLSHPPSSSTADNVEHLLISIFLSPNNQ